MEFENKVYLSFKYIQTQYIHTLACAHLSLIYIIQVSLSLSLSVADVS